MKVFRKCPCKGSNLDKMIQPAILALLAEEPLHGYRMIQRMSVMDMFQGNKPPDAAGVYRCLKHMEKAGLVLSEWETADAGPSKRIFYITEQGRHCLCNWVDTLEEYQRSIATLLDEIKGMISVETALTCGCDGSATRTT